MGSQNITRVLRKTHLPGSNNGRGADSGVGKAKSHVLVYPYLLILLHIACRVQYHSIRNILECIFDYCFRSPRPHGDHIFNALTRNAGIALKTDRGLLLSSSSVGKVFCVRTDLRQDFQSITITITLTGVTLLLNHHLHGISTNPVWHASAGALRKFAASSRRFYSRRW